MTKDYQAISDAQDKRAADLFRAAPDAMRGNRAVTQAGLSWAAEDWEDGWVLPAPVGTFLPNPFGLYDIHGNVSEMCRDYPYDRGGEREGDGFREHPRDLPMRSLRGGDYGNTSDWARSSRRDSVESTDRSVGRGVRLSRALQ